MKVLAALSGGVDSAVAAALAVDAGHEVTGVHMALMRHRAPTRTGSRGCCSIEDASDARRAADNLAIPFYVWDLSEDFEALVIEDFLAEYRAGRTPNPCVRCNEHIKFATLARRARALGFDAVCTGHYARLTTDDAGARLRRAIHRAKDQSYVLAAAGPQGLQEVVLPLGTAASKAEVRAMAERRGLPMASKPDSYDICFIADGNTAGFLRERLGERPGPILDETGREVGTHRGIHAFTVGQRRGLGVPRPAADGRPRFVTQIDAAKDTVHIGPVEALSVEGFVAVDATWFGPAASGMLPCEVQVRAHGLPLRAQVTSADDATRLHVRLATPMRAVAPGQSVVVYAPDPARGDLVVAHARIV
ncbi:MAG: tRNA 2-thiouridine(34) synthase MnmA [Bifidobacteriaceae bacterium]|jgi:tRNA-specific 2-thiouridylase|nr:tRNA 2-thiouridine(34) synthase MnmA [Bifidobacteriaceae bacterium]